MLAYYEWIDQLLCYVPSSQRFWLSSYSPLRVVGKDSDKPEVPDGLKSLVTNGRRGRSHCFQDFLSQTALDIVFTHRIYSSQLWATAGMEVRWAEQSQWGQGWPLEACFCSTSLQRATWDYALEFEPRPDCLCSPSSWWHLFVKFPIWFQTTGRFVLVLWNSGSGT